MMPREPQSRAPPGVSGRAQLWPDLPEPLNGAALAVLLDLGMTTYEIAEYFHQKTGRVEALASSYGLATDPARFEPAPH